MEMSFLTLFSRDRIGVEDLTASQACLQTSAPRQGKTRADVGPSWESFSIPHSRFAILYRAMEEWKCDRRPRRACTVTQLQAKSHCIKGAEGCNDVGVHGTG